MLDIRRIREHPDEVRANLERRSDARVLEVYDRMLERDVTWRRVLSEVERARGERNRLARAVAEARKLGADAAAAKADAEAVNRTLESKERELNNVAGERDSLLKRLPNLLHESVPGGAGPQENVVVRTWGKPAPVEDWRKTHAEVLEALGLANFDRARESSGAGFYFELGTLALLDLALQRFALEHLMQRGFTPALVPLMLRRGPYEGVTDLADFESVMYKIQDEDLYLIATSEHPMATLHMDDVIAEDRLPVKLAGLSACFRKEIGAHGVDTKGLFRVHQFHKVEQFVFAHPDTSWAIHEEILRNAEDVFQALELPYRVVNICTGDIGTVAAKKYDIEAWSPRGGEYREVVSCSHCTDYQARRLNVRHGKRGGQTSLVHTLNSTAIATSRAIVMLVENHQQPDGTVAIPKALQPYMGGLRALEHAKR